MIKTLLAQVKEYKTPSLLAPLCAALEVFFDMSVPFVIAKLIDQGYWFSPEREMPAATCKRPNLQ